MSKVQRLNVTVNQPNVSFNPIRIQIRHLFQCTNHLACARLICLHSGYRLPCSKARFVPNCNKICLIDSRIFWFYQRPNRLALSLSPRFAYLLPFLPRALHSLSHLVLCTRTAHSTTLVVRRLSHAHFEHRSRCLFHSLTLSLARSLAITTASSHIFFGVGSILCQSRVDRIFSYKRPYRRVFVLLAHS